MVVLMLMGASSLRNICISCLRFFSFLFFFFGIDTHPLEGVYPVAFFYCINLHLPLAFWTGFALSPLPGHGSSWIKSEFEEVGRYEFSSGISIRQTRPD
jgi:hypothetical protein